MAYLAVSRLAYPLLTCSPHRWMPMWSVVFINLGEIHETCSTRLHAHRTDDRRGHRRHPGCYCPAGVPRLCDPVEDVGNRGGDRRVQDVCFGILVDARG